MGEGGQQCTRAPTRSVCSDSCRGDGGGDVSRRSASGTDGPAAAASAGPGVQQPPGSEPCTPEAPCEAEACGLWCRSAGRAEQAPTATATCTGTGSSTHSAAGAAESCASSFGPFTLRRIRSFAHCVAGSPIVQSALLYLELEGEHPTALPASGSQVAAAAAAAGLAESEAAAGLEWTLAQVSSDSVP